MGPINEISNILTSNEEWKLSWIGEITHDAKLTTYKVNSIFQNTLSNEFRTVFLPIYLSPLLTIGSIWKNGIVINEVHGLDSGNLFMNTKDITFKATSDEYFEDKIKKNYSNSIFIYKKENALLRYNVDIVAIPHFEVMRFYFFRSRKLIEEIMASLNKVVVPDSFYAYNLNMVTAAFKKSNNDIYLKLKRGFEHIQEAKVISRLAFDMGSHHSIKIFTNTISREKLAGNNNIKINTRFPFESDTDLRFKGSIIQQNGPRILLIEKIIGCSYPYPSRNIRYNTNDTRPGESKEGAQERKKPSAKRVEDGENDDGLDTNNNPDHKYDKIEEGIDDFEDYSPNLPIVTRVRKTHQKTIGRAIKKIGGTANGNSLITGNSENSGRRPLDWVVSENKENFTSFDKFICLLKSKITGSKSFYIDAENPDLISDLFFIKEYPLECCEKNKKFLYTKIRGVDKKDKQKYRRHLCVVKLNLKSKFFYIFEIEPNVGTHFCFAIVSNSGFSELNRTEIKNILSRLAENKGIWQNIPKISNITIKYFKHYFTENIENIKKNKNEEKKGKNYDNYLNKIVQYLKK